ncbi:MAG TPA: TetR family transcriptional regulator [Pseudonocardiaceae bacterium]|jgi:AcrR family transcriptional regulator|nr:TetR family transcriptional regulator [Pseudonocardiaceae bacterium]
MTEAGLRERKKQRTRGALIDAAFTLFERKGFDATTIDEIADAVDVSPRTFFRYFASKEEVALSLLDEQLGFLVEVLAARPADEPVLTALHHAAVEVVRGCESGAGGFDADRYETMQRLVAANPALAAHGIELGAVRMAEVARLVGERMGVDQRTDPRPRLVASVGLCAVQTAVNAWRENDRDARSSDLVDTAFRLLTEGINYPAAPRT